jgi:hypothetical protein
MIDPFDPRAWNPVEHEWRIYGDDNASVWAVVDEEDYRLFAGSLWHAKRDYCGKLYMRRSQGPRHNRQTLYLHIEIVRAWGLIPPSSKHIYVDHRNGDSLDNRRDNLRWATASMNNRNRHGCMSHELWETGHEYSYQRRSATADPAGAGI